MPLSHMHQYLFTPFLPLTHPSLHSAHSERSIVECSTWMQLIFTVMFGIIWIVSGRLVQWSHFYKSKLKGFFFVTNTIIQSITSSEMCSLHLTHPSAHTLGAVGSQCCGARGAVGGSVPCSRVSPQSWRGPAGAEIRAYNLRLQVQRAIH